MKTLAIGITFLALAVNAQAQQQQVPAPAPKPLPQIQNEALMKEAVQNMGLELNDQLNIIVHVKSDGGQMTAASLRESDISDAAFNQFMDDAAFE